MYFKIYCYYLKFFMINRVIQFYYKKIHKYIWKYIKKYKYVYKTCVHVHFNHKKKNLIYKIIHWIIKSDDIINLFIQKFDFPAKNLIDWKSMINWFDDAKKRKLILFIHFPDCFYQFVSFIYPSYPIPTSKNKT